MRSLFSGRAASLLAALGIAAMANEANLDEPVRRSAPAKRKPYVHRDTAPRNSAEIKAHNAAIDAKNADKRARQATRKATKKAVR